MIRLLVFLMVLAPSSAWADFKLSDMVGNWSGSGKYWEPLTTAQMGCKLRITGTDAKVSLSGRCGSSIAAEKLVLDFVRQGDGQIVVTAGKGAPPSDSPIGSLTGTPSKTELFVRGQSGAETVVMQFTKQPDGTIKFATERDGAKGRRVSVVMLTRR